MYKKINIMVISLSLLFSAGVMAQELNDTPRTSTKAQERIQALQEKREAQKLKNCERVEAKLETKIKNFEKNKANHIASFKKSYQKMVSLAEKFEAEGYDTTVLRDHLAALDSMIKKFEADYSLYIQTTQDSQSLSCTETESTFEVKLNQSRDQLSGLKNQAVAIRTYWAQTIRVDIQALKALVDADKEITDEDSTSNTEGTN